MTSWIRVLLVAMGLVTLAHGQEHNLSFAYSIHGDRELVKAERMTASEIERIAAAEKAVADAEEKLKAVETEVKEAHGQTPEGSKALEGYDCQFDGKMIRVYHWKLNPEDPENQQ
jgi:hypothetical protein